MNTISASRIRSKRSQHCQVVGALAMLLLSAAAAAQTAPEFEAASVRLLSNGPPRLGAKRGGPGSSDPGRIVYEGVPFVRLLMDAWDLPADQFAGPAWATTLNSEVHYQVQATLPPGTTTPQLAQMLRKLLFERFSIAVRSMPRPVQGYSLVVGKGGPKISKSHGPVAEAEHGIAQSNGHYDPNSFEADGFPRLSPWENFGGTMGKGVVRMRFRDYTMDQLATRLSYTLAARVKDATSLQGKYDFLFEFSPPGGGSAGVRAVMPLPADLKLIHSTAPDESQLACVPVISSGSKNNWASGCRRPN